MPHDPRQALRAAYDPEEFRRRGHALIDQLADYLGQTLQGEGAPAPLPPPRELAARWPLDAITAGGADLGSLTEAVLRAAIHQHHPGYVGHQVSTPLPTMALAELTAALLNNGMAVYEAGPVSTVIERALCTWLSQKLGLGPRAGGVLTSGGSLGNLTALLAARQLRSGADAWTEGNPEDLRILCSSETHYCVGRAARIMGLGDAGVITAPVDARHRMRPETVEALYQDAASEGQTLFAVVASAGSTSTGAIDPLDEIAEVCARHGLWLHVDGAHGASLALSPVHRERLRGIERADSVVWDLHKMMMTPSLATAVLFRHEPDGYSAFAQQAPYLFPGDDAPDANVGLRTLECTKRMASLKLYTALAVHGEEIFAAYVEQALALARRFVSLLRARPGFSVAVEPDLNIVCFRYEPPGQHDDGTLQDELRRRVIERGKFYLVRTQLRGRVYLRVTLTNPLTTEAHLVSLLDELEAAARELPQ